MSVRLAICENRESQSHGQELVICFLSVQDMAWAKASERSEQLPRLSHIHSATQSFAFIHPVGFDLLQPICRWLPAKVEGLGCYALHVQPGPGSILL